jgi:hypothetical protein
MSLIPLISIIRAIESLFAFVVVCCYHHHHHPLSAFQILQEEKERQRKRGITKKGG